MTQPIIKAYIVPSGYLGINNVLHKQSLEYPDIVYDEVSLLPIEEAVDITNLGSPGKFEEDPKYKILLSSSDESAYYCDDVAFGTKPWVENKLGFEPKIFVKKNIIYAENEVWEYEYIPKYDSYNNNNYIINISGIIFDNDYINNNTELFNYDMYASFYYWEDISYQHPSSSNVKGYFAADQDDYVSYTSPSIEASGVDISASGDFFHDYGIFRWSTAPSGVEITVGGYHHTWERLGSDDLNSLFLDSGEISPSGISSAKFLVKDFTESGPWYQYKDIKIINESDDTALEKFFVQPILRGKLNSSSEIYEGFPGYLDVNKPWDAQAGQAEETVGYTGVFANSSNVFTALMWEQDYCWASGIDPYSINSALPSGLDINNNYTSKYKFPDPCLAANTTVPITFYRSTVKAPDGRYAFSYSRDTQTGSGLVEWAKQNPQNAEFKIMDSGSFASDGFPVSDSVYLRCLYTLRNFDFNTSNSNLSNWSSNPQFININESDGSKVFSLSFKGTYYE